MKSYNTRYISLPSCGIQSIIRYFIVSNLIPTNDVTQITLQTLLEYIFPTWPMSMNNKLANNTFITLIFYNYPLFITLHYVPVHNTVQTSPLFDGLCTTIKYYHTELKYFSTSLFEIYPDNILNTYLYHAYFSFHCSFLKHPI